jgi:hypothetical protein
VVVPAEVGVLLAVGAALLDEGVEDEDELEEVDKIPPVPGASAGTTRVAFDAADWKAEIVSFDYC